MLIHPTTQKLIRFFERLKTAISYFLYALIVSALFVFLPAPVTFGISLITAGIVLAVIVYSFGSRAIARVLAHTRRRKSSNAKAD